VGSKAGSKPQSDEGQIKGMKMKSCIFNLESEKRKDKKAIFSLNLKREKSKDIKEMDSSVKMEKLLDKQSKSDKRSNKKEKLKE
jgi:hypothetical protein